MGIVAGSAGGDHRGLAAVSQRQLGQPRTLVLGAVNDHAHIVLILLNLFHILIGGRAGIENIGRFGVLAILRRHREERLGDTQEGHPVGAGGQLILQLGYNLVGGKLVVGNGQGHASGVRRGLLVGHHHIQRIGAHAEVVGGNGITTFAARVSRGTGLAVVGLICGRAAGGQ